MQNSKNVQTLCTKTSSEILPKTIATSNNLVTSLSINNLEKNIKKLELENARLKPRNVPMLCTKNSSEILPKTIATSNNLVTNRTLNDLRKSNDKLELENVNLKLVNTQLRIELNL